MSKWRPFLIPKSLVIGQRRQYSSRILPAYLERVKAGELKEDPHQLAVIQRLEELDLRLLHHKHSGGASSSSSMLRRLLSSLQLHRLAGGDSRGLYLYGDVGCGKTMLMDLFYEHCSVNPASKRRVHFHVFMLEFHNRLHRYKLEHRLKHSGSGPALNFNPIPAIAAEFLRESWLLFLDEFQVTDIGDAMILRHMFKELFDGGLVLLATSNRAPDDLYKNGLQRSNFLPFIPMLKKHCQVLKLNTGIDYRRLVAEAKGVNDSDPLVGKGHLQVFYVTSPEASKTLDTVFKILASEETDSVRPRVLTIKGRNVTFAKACGQVLDSTFVELCDTPLGAADYHQISNAFHTIIIREIPKMNLTNRSQTRRFITLVDTLYDQRNRVLFSAEVEPDELFSEGKGENLSTSDEARLLMDDLDVDDSAAIFSGEEEIFAFYRTLSRMAEMQSAAYWKSAGPDKK